MLGDATRARRAHFRARRAWLSGDHRAAHLAQDQAIELFGRTNPHRTGRAVEYAALLIAGAELAVAAADNRAGVRRYQRAREAVGSLPEATERDEALCGALVGLAHCYRRLGQFPDAADCLNAAQELPALAPTSLAATHNAQGVLCKDTGQFAAAADNYARAIKALTEDESPQLSLWATIQHNVAGLAHAQHRFADGEEPARRAVALRQRAPGSTEIDVALDQVVLAAILAGQDKLNEAETLIRHAIATWTKHFGPQHYEVAVCLNNLADVQRRRGQLHAAEHSFQRALTIKTQVLGEAHAEIAILLNNLAAVHHTLGQTDQATREYAAALELFRATLGEDHPHTAVCRAEAAAAAD